MTNYEKYKEKIDKFLQDTYRIAVDKNERELVDCRELNCKNCLFSSSYNEDRFCEVNRIKWLVSEYKESGVDWSKVPIDTPVLASMDREKWYNFYFAGTDDWGNTYVYSSGRTSWSSKTAYDSETVKVPYIKLAEVSDEESK